MQIQEKTEGEISLHLSPSEVKFIETKTSD